MSEHLTAESYLFQKEKFKNNLDDEKSMDQANESNKEEANKLFDLINQLNISKNTTTTTTNNNKESSSELAPSDSNSDGCLLRKANVEENSLNLSNDSMTSSTSASNDDKNSTTVNSNNLKPENGNFSVSELNKRLNGLQTNTNEADNAKTRGSAIRSGIPRIPNLKSSNAFPVAPAAPPTTLNLTNLMASQQQQQQQKEYPDFEPTRKSKLEANRVTRSSSKTSCVNRTTSNIDNNNYKNDDNNNKSINQKPIGDSLNNMKQSIQKQRDFSTSSVNNNNNKPLRSSSMVSSPNGDDSFSNEPEFNKDGTKNVKYVFRYKPKESQVKIFSQKVQIKNVSSKIGSFAKANYVPGGGNVVIESKQLAWNAQSKIRSLEYANYQPNGGNVKIENRKLNWQAQSKIRSLDHANYQPAGGNVKIESHKLNFREKARPKTDTGLMMIEIDSKPITSFSSIANSQSNSNERLNDGRERRLSFGSN